MLVYQPEIISACTETTWQHETSLHHDWLVVVVCSYSIASYHGIVLLFEVDMDHNCTRTGYNNNNPLLLNFT